MAAATSNGAVAEGASVVAFLAFVTLLLSAGAAVAGALTVQAILGGVAIPNKSMACAIIAVILLVAAGVFASLAALFA
jgi:hypothetical protein